MRAIAGAAGQVAYSASMNSYTSLTDAPPRSTPRLLKGNQPSSAARGSPVRVPAPAPVPERRGCAQCLLSEVDRLGRVAEREGCDADIRGGGGAVRGVGGALEQDRGAVRDGCQARHRAGLLGIAGLRDRDPQARLKVL